MASVIRFEPAGHEGLVAKDTTLAAAADRLGVRIELECEGRGECTSCAVVVEANPLGLSPLTAAEERLLTGEQIAASARLACQARVGEADCVVRVPPQAEAKPADGEPGEQAPPKDSADARERIRESFTSLPVGEQIAAVLEMQVKIAGEIVGAVVEGPLRAGEELLASLFGGPDEKKGGTDSEDTKAGETAGEPRRGEEGDRHE
jgi:ferredoxin